MSNCPACNAANEANALFCVYCGAALTPASLPDSTPLIAQPFTPAWDNAPAPGQEPAPEAPAAPPPAPAPASTWDLPPWPAEPAPAISATWAAEPAAPVAVVEPPAAPETVALSAPFAPASSETVVGPAFMPPPAPAAPPAGPETMLGSALDSAFAAPPAIPTPAAFDTPAFTPPPAPAMPPVPVPPPAPYAYQGGYQGAPAAAGLKDRSMALILEIGPGIFGFLGIGWLYAGNTGVGLGALIGMLVWDLMVLAVIVVGGIFSGGIASCCCGLPMLLVNAGAIAFSAYQLNNYTKQHSELFRN